MQEVSLASPTRGTAIKKARKSDENQLVSLSTDQALARIRFMECILHISYRLDFKVGQARGTENREKVAEKKKMIQEKFRNELGLLVDIPKQQAGNTNDGNTAHKFFKDEEITAEITGVNRELIERFGLILQCLNCGFEINLDAFENFVEATRNLYLR